MLLNSKYIITALVICWMASFAYGQNEIQLMSSSGHFAPVNDFDVSPNGKLAITASDDNTIRLWEMNTGRALRIFKGAYSNLNVCKFSPDGTKVFAGSENGNLLIWELINGELLDKQRTQIRNIESLAIHPDGALILTAGRDDYASLWDMLAKESVNEFPVSQDILDFTKVQFSKDGNTLATLSPIGSINVYNTKSGNIELSLVQNQANAIFKLLDFPTAVIYADPSNGIRGFDGLTGMQAFQLSEQASSLNLTPQDYQSLGLIGEDLLLVDTDLDLSLIHIPSNELLRSYPKLAIASKQSIPDPSNDSLLVILNESEIFKVNLYTGAVIKTIPILADQVQQNLAEISPINKRSEIANKKQNFAMNKDGIAAKPNNLNEVIIWDFEKANILRKLDHESKVIDIEWAGTELLVSGCENGDVYLWDARTGRRIIRFQEHLDAVYDISISNNDQWAASASKDGTLKIWDLQNYRFYQGIVIDNAIPHQSEFTKNDLYVCVATSNGSISLHDLDTGEAVKHFSGHRSMVNHISIDQNGNRFASAGEDGLIKVWNLASGLAEQRVLLAEKPSSLLFKGSDLLVGTETGSIRRIDLASGIQSTTLAAAGGSISSLRFDPNEQYLISQSTGNIMSIWEYSTKKKLVDITWLQGSNYLISNADGYFYATDDAFQDLYYTVGNYSLSVDQLYESFYDPDLLEKGIYNFYSFNERSLISLINEQPPPQVKLISPLSGTEFTGDQVNLFFSVEDKGGGIRKVKVRHNGKYLNKPALENLDQVGDKTFNTKIDLVQGENNIELIALSKEGLSSQISTLNLRAILPNNKPNCYVTVIGINEYQNSSLNLRYAVNDARSFSEQLKIGGEQLYNEIFVTELFDANATKSQILNHLSDMEKQVNADDVYIFFFAGHGVNYEGDFYFSTTSNDRLYDAKQLSDNGISSTDIGAKFKAIRALKQVMILDACSSGLVVGSLSRGANEEKAMAQLWRNSGMHILASSGKTKEASEVPQLKHGLFSYLVLEALKGKTEVLNSDNVLTIYELKQYLMDEFPILANQYLGNKQFPVTYSTGNDFPLIMTK